MEAKDRSDALVLDKLSGEPNCQVSNSCDELVLVGGGYLGVYDSDSGGGLCARTAGWWLCATDEAPPLPSEWPDPFPST